MLGPLSTCGSFPNNIDPYIYIYVYYNPYYRDPKKGTPNLRKPLCVQGLGLEFQGLVSCAGFLRLVSPVNPES